MATVRKELKRERLAKKQMDIIPGQLGHYGGTFKKAYGQAVKNKDEQFVWNGKTYKVENWDPDENTHTYLLEGDINDKLLARRHVPVTRKKRNAYQQALNRWAGNSDAYRVLQDAKFSPHSQEIIDENGNPKTVYFLQNNDYGTVASPHTFDSPLELYKWAHSKDFPLMFGNSDLLVLNELRKIASGGQEGFYPVSSRTDMLDRNGNSRVFFRSLDGNYYITDDYGNIIGVTPDERMEKVGFDKFADYRDPRTKDYLQKSSQYWDNMREASKYKGQVNTKELQKAIRLGEEDFVNGISNISRLPLQGIFSGIKYGMDKDAKALNDALSPLNHGNQVGLGDLINTARTTGHGLFSDLAMSDNWTKGWNVAGDLAATAAITGVRPGTWFSSKAGIPRFVKAGKTESLFGYEPLYNKNIIHSPEGWNYNTDLPVFANKSNDVVNLRAPKGEKFSNGKRVSLFSAGNGAGFSPESARPIAFPQGYFQPQVIYRPGQTTLLDYSGETNPALEKVFWTGDYESNGKYYPYHGIKTNNGFTVYGNERFNPNGGWSDRPLVQTTGVGSALPGAQYIDLGNQEYPDHSLAKSPIISTLEFIQAQKHGGRLRRKPRYRNGGKFPIF